ncbi:hypothetical protein MMC30_004740 [Trapelia coarctata]|nr:hypothetical protein [Trapelia coarctata]
MDDFVKHTKDRDDNKSEKARLTDQHDVMMDAMGGKAIFVPIDLSKPGLRILDSGTADGRWLFGLRSTSPAKHEYVGIDIDEGLYPESAPEDMHFQNQSIREPFPAEWQGSFDLVHQRLVMAAAPPETVLSVVKRLAGLLKPGAWLQLVEVDTDSVPDNGPALRSFLNYAQQMSAASGMGPNLAKDLAGAMQKAGLQNVEQQSIDIMHGFKNKDESLKQKSIDSLCNAVPPLMQGVKMILPDKYNEEEASTLQSRLRKEFEESGGSTKALVVCGQKA